MHYDNKIVSPTNMIYKVLDHIKKDLRLVATQRTSFLSKHKDVINVLHDGSVIFNLKKEITEL